MFPEWGMINYRAFTGKNALQPLKLTMQLNIYPLHLNKGRGCKLSYFHPKYTRG